MREAGKATFRGRAAGLRAPLLAAVLALIAPYATRAQAPDTSDAVIDALLARMTVEEKVGEMTQLTLQAVSRTMGTPTVAHQIDPERLEEALLEYHVGSLLNVWDVAFTPEHWHEVIGAVQRVAERKRLGIPVLYGIDAVHGHHYQVGGTIFPQNLALAATFDPELVRRSNEITAFETRASGIPWNFSPVLDLGRQPLWSRFFETFGEDPYLAGVLGAAAVRGLQGDDLASPDRVAATGKHFLGYSAPRSGKDRSTAWIPDRQLHEYFVPPFRAAMDAGLATVMINSGDINGVPVHASREILTGLLRDDLGFEGVAVTDWEDIIKLHTVHRVAATPKEAVRMAVMAGVDMSMVPYDLSFAKHLVELVREGQVPESRLDESVRRILRLKVRLGLFEDPYPDPAMAARIGAPEFQAVSRRAAEEAITLLKNEGGLLPLEPDARVLVTGPGATSLPALHGSWTYTWQGTNEAMYPESTPSVLEALRTELGAARVSYVPGASMDEPIDIDAAAAAARSVDVAIVVLAEQPSTEQPGDIEDLTLQAAQLELARAVRATGTPTVLVMLFNRPRIVRSVVDGAGAVVLAYEPGPHGGPALADVLSGDVNPSGRLPFTYPRHTGSLVHYDHLYSERIGAEPDGGRIAPQWPFGHGLSYTTFEYHDLRLDRQRTGPDGRVTVTVDVENTGRRAGKEVVQLYVSDLYATVAPPVKRLRGFRKVELAPGERRTVAFELDVRDLAFIGHDLEPVVEPGAFEVAIGDERARFTVVAP